MANLQLGILLAVALIALLSVSDVACDHRTFSRKQLEADGKDVGDDPVISVRREKVKDAMLHAWTSYEKYAWGFDQLQVWWMRMMSLNGCLSLA